MIKLKNLILVGFLLLFFSCSNKSDVSDLGLVGKVKSFSEQTYEAKFVFGELIQGDRTYSGNSKVIFDNSENFQCKEEYCDEGQLKSKSVKKDKTQENYFNEQGELIAISKIVKKTPEVIEHECLNLDGSIFCKTTEEIKNGKVVKKVMRYKEIESPFVVEYQYDNKGLIQVEKSTYGSYQTYKRFDYIEFDKVGNWTKALVYDSNETANPSDIIVRTYQYYN